LQKEVFVQVQKNGGVLASTHRWKRRRHVEDGSLASLKTGPKNKRRQRRSRSRGLIDRDICRGTPATTANVDSRLANRWSDRAGSISPSRMRKWPAYAVPQVVQTASMT